jgi:hypothetical protein
VDICMLTLEGSRAAEVALEETLLVAQNRFRWLDDVNIVRRSALGRLTILACSSRDEHLRFEYEEGELAERAARPYRAPAALPSPLAPGAGADGSWLVSMLADEVERRFFHTEVFRRLLQRDTSALLLVADADACLAMTRLFARYHPRVMSRRLQGSPGDGLAALGSQDDLLPDPTRTSRLH